MNSFADRRENKAKQSQFSFPQSRVRCALVSAAVRRSSRLRAKIVFWITFLACLGMMIGGYLGLRSAGDAKGIILWAIFIMIGFNSTILMKLWYWVENTKLNILKEMKELQLQIAELTSKTPSPVRDGQAHETGG